MKRTVGGTYSMRLGGRLSEGGVPMAALTGWCGWSGNCRALAKVPPQVMPYPLLYLVFAANDRKGLSRLQDR